MVKFDWLQDAAKVIEAAAKDPTFPGDAPPTLAVLERVVNKALSECHNGGILGADGCVPCRAYRTEKVEKELTSLRDELDSVINDLAAAKGELFTKTKALDNEVATSKSLAESLQVADKAYDEALAKIEMVTKHASQLAYELSTAQKNAAAAEAKAEASNKGYLAMEARLNQVLGVVGQLRGI